MTLGEGVLSGAGTAIGEDLYKRIKEFLLSRPESEQKALVKETSIIKPGAFMAFELDRISHEAASYLLSLPPSERNSLIGIARQGTADDTEKILFNLLRIIQRKN